MLDPNLLRKDLDSVVAALQKRKNPQQFLDVAAYSALEAEHKTITPMRCIAMLTRITS
jgi:seryl-tRNA synthetase